MTAMRNALGRFVKGQRSNVAGEFKKGHHLSFGKRSKPSWRKGKKFSPLSEEHRKKIGASLKGIKRPPLSEEHKSKLRSLRIGKPGVKSMLGKKHTEEWKKAASERARKRMSNIDMVRRVLGRRPMSSLELRVQAVIDKHNLPFRYVGNGQFFIDKKNPDFVSTDDKRIAVEVYARRHKEMFRNISIDEWRSQRQELFNNHGWGILFIEDYQTNKEDYLLNLLKQGGHH